MLIRFPTEEYVGGRLPVLDCYEAAALSALLGAFLWTQVFVSLGNDIAGWKGGRDFTLLETAK